MAGQSVIVAPATLPPTVICLSVVVAWKAPEASLPSAITEGTPADEVVRA